MLPIKLDLTEKVAATLRQLRLDYPVNGEVLTAEGLSKAIGNNRAWMSQIESRRLKKIKREDIIKIYKLLHNESDDKIAEQMAEADLCSPFETRYDSDKNNSSFVNDSYSEGIVSLDNLMSDLRDVLLDEYKKLDNHHRNSLLGCVESMIDNFRNDYEHTYSIYTVPISYADPDYFGEKYAKEYYQSLDVVCSKYTMLLSEAYHKADIDSFLASANDIYTDTLQDINSIDLNTPSEDMMNLTMWIKDFSWRTFSYIERLQNNCVHDTTLSLDDLFRMITELLNAFFAKLKLNYKFSVPIPTVQSTENELNAKKLEISNAIMLIIQHISKFPPAQ